VTQPLRLATRGSPLALAQAAAVGERLASIGVASDVVVVETEGDRRRDVELAVLAGRGVFTKEVQAAVLDGRADVAVHSAKDLPASTPTGLRLAAVPERGDPADALVGKPLQVLAPGATVATGAPRRRALLLHARPDLHVVGVRGNVATRLDTVGRDGVDAVVVAVAALVRLGLEGRIAERLATDRFVPQVGQGALALECRADGAVAEVLSGIDDADAHAALDAERAFLDALGAGCEIPGGALATRTGAAITIHGTLLSEDGAVEVRATVTDEDPGRAGRGLAAELQAALVAASPQTS
jgi:hydroxymethylbilane synthase